MWSAGGNIFRQTQDTQWLIEGTLFSHLKRRVNNIKMGKKFRHNQGMIMILSCIMMDSLRNALTLVLMHLTQRKTKSINYWLINSLTCPAVIVFGSLQWYFLSNYNGSIDWWMHSKYLSLYLLIRSKFLFAELTYTDRNLLNKLQAILSVTFICQHQMPKMV